MWEYGKSWLYEVDTDDDDCIEQCADPDAKHTDTCSSDDIKRAEEICHILQDTEGIFSVIKSIFKNKSTVFTIFYYQLMIYIVFFSQACLTQRTDEDNKATFENCVFDQCLVGTIKEDGFNPVCSQAEALTDECLDTYGVTTAGWRSEDFCRMFTIEVLKQICFNNT